MKNNLNIRAIFLVVLGVFLCTSLFAQKKNKVRLKASYVKIMNDAIYFDVTATAKVDKKFITVSNIDLTVFNVTDEDRVVLGNIKTNAKGQGRLSLKNINALKADIDSIYNISVNFIGNDLFQKSRKSLSFKDAEITASIYTEDSINYVTTTLINPLTKSPIVDAYLDVQIKRLFKPLKIGEEFNITDDSGTVVVPIPEGIPGLNGDLTFEVVLNESDDYGTVKAIINAPIGKHIVDESTFDQRTMWSPKNKTPLFLLIFTNILIFGVWGIIVYLFINLIKISKS